MLKDIVLAQSRTPYQIHLQFEDGVAGVVDLRDLVEFVGVFEPLRDPGYCARVQVNPEIGTIFGENGADLDPDVLCAIVSKQPIPKYTSQPAIAE
jgi:Protein of unknown function (DUF2442)